MITKLLNDVQRELLGTHTNDKYRHRAIIITIKPGDLIEFRVKGTQQKFEVPLAQCFKLAQIIGISQKHKEAVNTYKEKRKAGFKVRKPKKPVLPYSDIYFNAMSGIKQG